MNATKEYTVTKKQRYQTDNRYRLRKIHKTAQSCTRTPDAEPARRRILSRQQKYWIRRSKLLAAGRLLDTKLKQQKRMTKDCNISLLDVKMLFHKADTYLKQASLRQKLQHKRLVSKIDDIRKQLSTDTNNKPTEDDISHAFGDRQHTSTTEPYFWEQSYQPARISDAIAVDSDGRAHYFKHFTRSSVSCDLNSDTAEHNRKTTECWQCNPLICCIEQGVVDGVVSLMEKVSSVQMSRCCAFYQHIDSCTNPTRSDALGHPIYCQFDVNCKSLLRPLRILSVHFPALRTLLARVYELKRFSKLSYLIRELMQCGSYGDLRHAVDTLADVLTRTSDKSSSPTGDLTSDSAVTPVCIDEQQLMETFGSALREVANIRDNYITSACDICEQLREDLKSLKEYEDTKGFSSEKMTEVIELLYTQKTQHEDIDDFLRSMFICSYCADKLRSGKDVARSAFNKLAVIETPSCIKELNLFELALIKFCMTCVTVVRLGQVTNTRRPSNELNAALKGRIVYLPVDVSSNSTFLPENLLNLDSLLLLVGGQPTRSKRVWASVVDLRKVHTALLWLREHNPLYKDVPVYSLDDIKERIERRLGSSDAVDESVGDTLLRKLSESAKSKLYESFTVQPISSEFPADSMVEYQMDKVHGTSSDIFDTELDLKAYPELFPTGCNGMREATRQVKIGTSDFIKSRLLNKDPKFRLNLNYLFHCFQVQEVSNMSHSVGHMLRTVTGRNMSARDLFERLKARDGEMQSKMFSLLANIRGTREYFAKLGMEVRWMIRTLGPPTLFVTCSAAEWFSDALVSHLRTVNATVSGIEKMSAAELCVLDPVTVSIHFQKKWSAIFQKLIRSKKTPIFGEVADYFWRIEYQARGAPHVHCLLWIKDAPVIGRDSPETVKEYIDKTVTCRKPNPQSSPTLSQLVSKFQDHHCNKYCQKSYKKDGKFYKKCRFGFPRPVRTETKLNDVIDCLAVDQRKQPRRRLYHIRRSEDEVTINDYNAALLLANEANVDVQFIGHVGSRLSYYVTDYMSKYERTEQDDMWSDIFSSARSLGSNAMSFLLKSVKSRQVGAVEAADRLLGHKLYSKSRQTIFANLQPPDQVKRVLKPAAELEQLCKTSPESEDIFYPHWVLNIYPNRPDCLQNASLHEVMAWYERQKSGTDEMKVNTLPLYLRRRQKPYIVTHQNVNPHQSEEHRQLYYSNLLKLFVPWRSQSDLVVDGKGPEDVFNDLSQQYPEMADYHKQYTQTETAERELEDAVRRRGQEPDDNDVEPDSDNEEGALQGCAVDHMQTAMNDIQEAHRTSTMDAGKPALREAYSQLNVDQKRIVDRVAEMVCHGEEPVHLIVSGQGGTGKSRVIDILNRIVSSHFGEGLVSVITAGPTGLSAWSVGGTTIHRILSLPIEHGKPPNYSRLNQDQLNMIRQTLKGLRLLLIDELSMVSSLTLMFIHLRLTEIMSKNDLFGGISLVCFADFLQLPPVKGNQPFVKVTDMEAKQRLGSIASFDIWKAFSYDELTINMRQSGDTSYAQILSEVRIGHVSSEGHRLLCERIIANNRRATAEEICDLYCQLAEEGKSPMILMPRTDLCDSINRVMLSRFDTDIVSLPAVDMLDTVIEKGYMSSVQKAYDRVRDDVTRTAGLESHLELTIGARVMLKRNKNVEAGLVNGSVGTVTGFLCRSKEVYAINIQFDKVDCTVAIERESVSFEVLKCVYYTRKQFPVMTAFALTIHKAQGLSLQAAIVDAGSHCFGSGMIYVALSRVTSLAGLHLIEFDSRKVVCDSKAIDEYNRLRRQYTPHLEQLPAHNKGPKSTKRKSQTANQEDGIHAGKTDSDSTTLTDTINLITGNVSEQSTSGLSANTANTQHNNETALQETQSIWRYCRLTSLDDTFKAETCERLNLQLHPITLSTLPCISPDVSFRLQADINKQTGQCPSVKVLKVSGRGGNCLFRALSLAITNTESQHEIIRGYIVNHLQHSDICEQLRTMYTGSDIEYQQYLLSMQNNGEWGTDLEIAAAAHLLQCSIVCYQQYDTNGQYVFQHFAPHYAETTDCSDQCCHNATLYLVNTSGVHYDLAIVTDRLNLEE